MDDEGSHHIIVIRVEEEKDWVYFISLIILNDNKKTSRIYTNKSGHLSTESFQ